MELVIAFYLNSATQTFNMRVIPGGDDDNNRGPQRSRERQ
jgi:hypothetical protein